MVRTLYQDNYKDLLALPESPINANETIIFELQSASNLSMWTKNEVFYFQLAFTNY